VARFFGQEGLEALSWLTSYSRLTVDLLFTSQTSLFVQTRKKEFRLQDLWLTVHIDRWRWLLYSSVKNYSEGGAFHLGLSGDLGCPELFSYGRRKHIRRGLIKTKLRPPGF